MQINLFNAKNPNGKRVPITVTIEQVDLIQTNDGEIIYIIGLYCGARGINGKQVDPYFINNITKPNIFDEISKGLSIIAAKINWGILEEDTHPPIITNIYPKNKDENIPISANVYMSIIDPFPASFIDKSTLQLKVNNIDITDQLVVKEKQNELNINWVPVKIYS